VLYRLWSIGMAASHLEVITTRGRTRKLWLWSWFMVFYGCLSTSKSICVISDVWLYMLYLLSSPYLLVIGDDRVRGTQEQMLLMQVALVKLSCGEGINRGNLCLLSLVFEISCKPLWVFLYNHLFGDYGFEHWLVI